MREGMRTALRIDAVGSTVTDLGICHFGIDMQQHQTIESMIMNTSAVQRQFRQGSLALAHAVEPDITGENIDVF